MEKVVVAIGSNVGDRRRHMAEARKFLAGLSEKKNLTRASSLYLTEPVGPSRRYFLNAAMIIHTSSTPEELIQNFKMFEREHGRSPEQPRWSARTIDLDLISFGDLVIQTDSLIIPHPEYESRKFVLEPLAELDPEWKDPKSGKHIRELLEDSPPLQVKKLTMEWKPGAT